MARFLASLTGSVTILVVALLVKTGAAGTFPLGPDLFRAFEARAAPLTAVPETMSLDTTFAPALSDAALWATLPVDDVSLDRNVSLHTCFVCPDEQPPAGLPPTCLSAAVTTAAITAWPGSVNVSGAGTIHLHTLVRSAWPSVCPSAVRLEHVVLADKRGSTEPIWPDKYVPAHGRADVSQSDLRLCDVPSDVSFTPWMLVWRRRQV